jgi:hypothetical protein
VLHHQRWHRLVSHLRSLLGAHPENPTEDLDGIPAGEWSGAVYQAVRRLTPEDLAILVLREGEEFSATAVAQMLKLEAQVVEDSLTRVGETVNVTAFRELFAMTEVPVGFRLRRRGPRPLVLAITLGLLAVAVGLSLSWQVAAAHRLRYHEATVQEVQALEDQRAILANTDAADTGSIEAAVRRYGHPLLNPTMPPEYRLVQFVLFEDPEKVGLLRAYVSPIGYGFGEGLEIVQYKFKDSATSMPMLGRINRIKINDQPALLVEGTHIDVFRSGAIDPKNSDQILFKWQDQLVSVGRNFLVRKSSGPPSGSRLTMDDLIKVAESLR